MLLSLKEFNILLAAGFYKDLPAALDTELGGDTLHKLVDVKLLRYNRIKTACRLTKVGVELLRKAGYKFHVDAHPLGEGDLLNRRLQSSEIALALQQIGINVFKTGEPQDKSETCYLSSYAIRRNNCANVLGMSKFSGYYYTPENIYVIYHLGSKLSGFYPNTESDIFFRHSMYMRKNVKIVFFGGCDYAEMVRLFNREKEDGGKNDCTFYGSVNEFVYNVSILPLNLTGLRILRIMSTPLYEVKLMKGIN